MTLPSIQPARGQTIFVNADLHIFMPLPNKNLQGFFTVYNIKKSNSLACHLVPLTN